MITEFIKEHKKLCIIILIAIIVILIIIKTRGKETNQPVAEVSGTTEEVSEPVDVATQLEDDETTQTVYNGYIYGAD